MSERTGSLLQRLASWSSVIGAPLGAVAGLTLFALVFIPSLILVEVVAIHAGIDRSRITNVIRGWMRLPPTFSATTSSGSKFFSYTTAAQCQETFRKVFQANGLSDLRVTSLEISARSDDALMATGVCARLGAYTAASVFVAGPAEAADRVDDLKKAMAVQLEDHADRSLAAKQRAAESGEIDGSGELDVFRAQISRNADISDCKHNLDKRLSELGYSSSWSGNAVRATLPHRRVLAECKARPGGSTADLAIVSTRTSSDRLDPAEAEFRKLAD